MSIKRYRPAVDNYGRSFLQFSADGSAVRYDDHDAEVARLTNKLNEDSQNFQIECQKAEIEMLRADLAAARAQADAYMAALSLFLHRPPGASYHELVERARAALPTAPSPEYEPLSDEQRRRNVAAAVSGLPTPLKEDI